MTLRHWTLALAALTILAACGTRVPGAAAKFNASLQVGRGGTGVGQLGSAGGGTDGSTASGAAGSAASAGASAAGSGGSQSAGGSGGGSGSSGGSAGGSGVNSLAVQSATASSPIVIGAVGTLSGIIGDALKSSWAGLYIWQSAVNAAGGIDGHPVKLIVVDDQGDPGHHAAAVRQLILDDHVVAFVGEMAPITFSAGTSILEQYKIPALGGDSSDSGWFDSPMAFPINSLNIPLGRSLGVWAPSHLKPKKAAVFYVDEAAASTLVAQSFEAPWTAAGNKVVVSQGVSLANPDYTTQVLSAQSAGADVVMLVLDGASCERFFGAARRQQYRPMVFEAGCTRQPIADNSDLTFGNTYFGGPYRLILPGTPAADELIRATARYGPGDDVDAAATTWLSGKLLEAAVAAGHGVTSAAIINGLHSLQNETLGGLIPAQSWPDGNHPAGQCGTIAFVNSTGQTVPETTSFIC